MRYIPLKRKKDYVKNAQIKTEQVSCRDLLRFLIHMRLLLNFLFVLMQNVVYDTNNLAAFQIYTGYSLCYYAG